MGKSSVWREIIARLAQFATPRGPHRLKVRRVAEDEDAITIFAETTAPSARCPTCRRKSNCVHSRYVRTIKDLPMQDLAVTIHVHSRRFRCKARWCSQKIFTERLDWLAAPYARKTAISISSHLSSPLNRSKLGLYLQP